MRAAAAPASARVRTRAGRVTRQCARKRALQAVRQQQEETLRTREAELVGVLVGQQRTLLGALNSMKLASSGQSRVSLPARASVYLTTPAAGPAGRGGMPPVPVTAPVTAASTPRSGLFPSTESVRFVASGGADAVRAATASTNGSARDARSRPGSVVTPFETAPAVAASARQGSEEPPVRGDVDAAAAGGGPPRAVVGAAARGASSKPPKARGDASARDAAAALTGRPPR